MAVSHRFTMRMSLGSVGARVGSRLVAEQFAAVLQLKANCKTLIPKATGCGAFDWTAGVPVIGAPVPICFISIQ